MNYLFWLIYFAIFSICATQNYLDETNSVRAANGKAALSYNANLEKAAQDHNNWMVSNNCFSHQCPGEPDLGNRTDNANYNWSKLAENIASGQASWKDCIADWMGDPGHAKNVCGDYEDLGCAYAVSGSTTYYTCDYGTQMSI